MSDTIPKRDDAASAIDAADLRRLLEAGQPVRLLDVRTPGEFAAAHIDGAVNIPLDQLKPVAAQLNAPDLGTLVVICQGGTRAASACAVLAEAGHRGAVLLTGGMHAWNSVGGPSDRQRGRWALERQVRFVAGLIVLLAVLASFAWTPAYYLAGMVGAGLVFAALTNTCAMGLLLAKLPYNHGSSCAIDTAVERLRR